jgi:hypothetical protein
MTQTMTAEDSRLRKIRGLLAKAESTTPEEAELLLAKVAELIVAWGIDEALLHDGDVTSGTLSPTSVTLHVDAPYAVAKTVLINGVATSLGCEAIRLNCPGSNEIVSVIGFPGDLHRVEVLSTSLLVQLTNALHSTNPPTHSRSATRAWRRSFVIGFASRVTARLEAQIASSTADAVAHAADTATTSSTGRSTELVLADRKEAVHNEFRRLYPRVRTARISSGSSASGAHAGQAAGDRASLATDSIGGARAAIGA